MRINKLLNPILFALILVLGIFLGSRLSSSDLNILPQSNSSKNKINRLIDLIEKNYVEDVNTDSIVDLTVNGILSSLDPHSVYISKNEIQAINESMRGDFIGIGINFYNYKDSIAVIKTIENGPSQKAGILAGDRILYVGNKKIYNNNISNDTLFSILKGEKGSTADLTIYRKSTSKKLKIKVQRDVVPIKSIEAATMVTEKMGYIKINRFAETTYTEFITAAKNLKLKGMKTLVIDLRDNGGGYLESAVSIADEFLTSTDIIVKTKNNKQKMITTFATKNGNLQNTEVVILINENSASASEILAGAIQDNDRGQIVGRRSFGKGLVQREMPLGDGSAVRLTTARYYTPSGRSIQKPYEDKQEVYFNEFEKRFLSGELYDVDSIKVADSLKYKTKKGRVVYGGGGIIPDVFVPFQAKKGEEALTMILNSGLMSYFVFEELDKNRVFFSELSETSLKVEIQNNDLYLKNFKNYINQSGYFIQSSTETNNKIKTFLYAEFLRQLFSEEAYFEEIIKQDSMINKVLEITK